MSDNDVMFLVSNGSRVTAIRKIAEAYGVTLLQARNEVDAIVVKYGKNMFRVVPKLSWEIEDKVRSVLKDDPGRNKIQAIKLCRELTMWGLREAKDAVEDIIDNRRDWPKIDYELWCEIVSYKGKGLDGARKAATVAMQLDVTEYEADYIVKMIFDGVIPQPKIAQYRSIDDEWHK